MQLLQKHPDELLYQLTFLEVAVSRLYTELWNEGNIYVQDIIDDYYDILSQINVESLDENCRYSIMFLTTPVLLIEKKLDELICTYYELLKWNTLVNSVKEHTGIDETYFVVVHNLIQILLIQKRVEEANSIREKYQDAIKNELQYFEAQIFDDDNITERYEKLINATISNDISYFFFCEYAFTSISFTSMSRSNTDTEKIIFGNHYSHIYSDCIENEGSFTYENEVFLMRYISFSKMENISWNHVKMEM